MKSVTEIDAYLTATAIAAIILWMISIKYLKTIVRLHKTDDPAYCGCGSHAPNLGSKSHYTAKEFAVRNEKKYRRSHAYSVEKAAQRAYKRYLKSRSPKDLQRSQDLNVRWHSIMDKHAEKCDKKWFACTSCKMISRRYYVPEEHQERYGLTAEALLEFGQDMGGSLITRAYNNRQRGDES